MKRTIKVALNGVVTISSDGCYDRKFVVRGVWHRDWVCIHGVTFKGDLEALSVILPV